MVERALDALEAFVEHDGELGLRELAARTHATRSSAYRILVTLLSRGYVERAGDAGYRLGPRLASLAEVARTRTGLAIAAEPHLERLREAFGETVNLGVVRGEKIVYVRVLESAQRFRISAAEGDVVPPHASALGKAILANSTADRVDALLGRGKLPRFTPNTLTSRDELAAVLARVRASGVASDEEEIEAGATCLGVAILSPDDDATAIAGISLSGPTARVVPRRAAIAAALKREAAAVTQAMRAGRTL